MRLHSPLRRISPLKHHTFNSPPHHRSYASKSALAFQEKHTSMLSRPPTVINDNLVPLPSHLYTTLLNSILPPSLTIPATDFKTLPQGAYLAYHPPLEPAHLLAPDGAESKHVPPGVDVSRTWEGWRRLWAGGDVVFRDGDVELNSHGWTCVEKVGDLREARGGYVVELEREYSPEGSGLASITEKRLLAFVESLKGATEQRAIKSKMTPTRSYTFTTTPTQLFQFSALTYNAHFIHLHPTEALVHGPLLLGIMLRALTAGSVSDGSMGTTSLEMKSQAAEPGDEHEDKGTKQLRRVQSITYRNLAPVYVGKEAKVCVRENEGKKWDVWVEGSEGGLAVKGSAIVV